MELLKADAESFLLRFGTLFSMNEYQFFFGKTGYFEAK